MRSQVSRRRTLGLASLVGCLALALMVSGVPAEATTAVVASDGAAVSPAKPVQRLERPDSVSAMVTARAIGERVEDLSQRTQESQVFANPDGTWTSDSASEPVRVQDTHGGWHDVDTTLVPRDRGFAPSWAASDLVLSGGGDRTFVQLTAKGHHLGWKWTQDLPAPVVKGNTATYSGVAPGDGDLVVTATTTGFSYDVVLHRVPTEPVVLTSPVVTDGAQIEQTAADGVAISTAAGKPVVAAPHPMMWDAQVDAQGEPVNVHAVATQVAATASGGRVILSPDQAFLTDPSTVYPVVVDPSFTTYTTGDMFIENVDKTDAQPGQDFLRVGSEDGGAHRFRTYLDFKDSDATKRWNGTHVTSATLRFWNYHSGSCASGAIRASMVAEDWATANLSWGNQPTVSGTLYDDYSAAHGNTNCDPDDADFNVTKIVDAWAHDPSSNHGIRIKAVDETSTNTYRDYRSVNYDVHPAWRPKLMVTYNRYPNQAARAAVLPGNPGYATSRTPSLSSKITDPDGGELRAKFTVYNGAGAPVWTGYSCASIATATCTSSGGTASVTVPSAAGLANGAAYTVKTWAQDATGDYSLSPSPITSFQVDVSRPTVVITSSDFVEGQWETDSPASNVLTFDGTSDTKSISYTLDGEPFPPKAADSNGDVSLSWLPANGYHRVAALATDKAGNTTAQPSSSFEFGVGGASFSSPGDGQGTLGPIVVEASSAPGSTGARLQWEYPDSSDPTWFDADGVTTQSDGSSWSGQTADAGAGKISTPGKLVWDITRQKNLDGTLITAPAFLALRMCFTYEAAPTSCTPTREVALDDGFGTEYPTADLGPGTVALNTGALSLSETDASGSSSAIGRSWDSLAASAIGSDAAFGRGWSTDLLSAGPGNATVTDRRTLDGTLAINFPGGGSEVFGADPDTANVYNPVDVRETGSSLRLTVGVDGSPDQLVLTENGDTSAPTTTTWKYDVAQEEWLLERVDAAGALADTSIETSDGRIDWVVQGSPGGEWDCTRLVQGPGCIGLAINYDSDGHVEKIIRKQHGASDLVVATYTYESGLLTRACGPAVDSGSLCVGYTYQQVGQSLQLTSVTPPGEAAWEFGYDSSGRAESVSRDRANGSGKSSWKIVYGADLSAVGLPDLSASKVGDWGQVNVPTKLFEVFSPRPDGSTPTADPTYAQLFYANADGTSANTATYGPSGWLVDTSWYDSAGNVVQTLDGIGWQHVMASAPEDRPQVAAEFSSFTNYDATHSSRVTDEYEPARSATLRDGITGMFRPHTHYVYADERPDLGGARPSDPSVVADDLLVERTTSVSDPEMVEDRDASTVRFEYSPNVAGDGNGWELGIPTRTLTQTDDGGWSIETSRFTADGQTLSATSSGGATENGVGTDARTTRYTYYTATGNPDPDCDAKPDWVGRLCKTTKVSAGSVLWNKEYDADGNPTSVIQMAGGTTRTLLRSYDPLGRVTSTTKSVDSGDPRDDNDSFTTSVSYGTQGRPTKLLGPTGAVTTAYDSWGRPKQYVDQSGWTTSSTYNGAGDIATIANPKDITNYFYDTRDSLIRVDGGPSLGAFQYVYNPGGAVASVTYPNGMVAEYSYDEVGQKVGISYRQGSALLLTFDAQLDAQGRRVATSSIDSDISYTYDALGRLAKVAETGTGACFTRTYGFDAYSNRTSTRLFGPAEDGGCQNTSAEEGVTLDAAADGRIRTSGFDYDSLGRLQVLPAAFTTSKGGSSPLAITYRVDDMPAAVRQAIPGPDQTLHEQESVYGLDAAERVHSIIRKQDGQETSRDEYHFTSDSDSPAEVSSSDDGGATWTSTRYLSVPELGMVETETGGVVEIEITNLHGDVVSAISAGAGSSGLEYYSELDEYGGELSADGGSGRRYEWLGFSQRSTDALGGLILMGARLYAPSLGEFTSPDSVEGGNATPYTYPQDPINHADITGLFDYYMEFNLGGTDENAYHFWSRVRKHFTNWFPIKGARPLKLGVKMPLVVYGFGFPVRVSAIYPRGWKFIALDGHPDGKGSWIHFWFRRRPGFNGGGDTWGKQMHLILHGHVKDGSWGGIAGNYGFGLYEAGARHMWGKLARGLAYYVRPPGSGVWV